MKTRYYNAAVASVTAASNDSWWLKFRCERGEECEVELSRDALRFLKIALEPIPATPVGPGGPGTEFIQYARRTGKEWEMDRLRRSSDDTLYVVGGTSGRFLALKGVIISWGKYLNAENGLSLADFQTDGTIDAKTPLAAQSLFFSIRKNCGISEVVPFWMRRPLRHKQRRLVLEDDE